MPHSEQILSRYELILTSAGEGIYGLDSKGINRPESIRSINGCFLRIKSAN